MFAPPSPAAVFARPAAPHRSAKPRAAAKSKFEAADPEFYPSCSREELTDVIRRKKLLGGYTWQQLAALVPELSPVYATCALLGEMRLTKSQAEAVAKELELVR